MAVQTQTEQVPIEQSPIEIAEPIIAQCRRDIAAGWAHVEAAREVLRRSPLLRVSSIAPMVEPISEELSHDRPRSEGFVMVPALKRYRSRRRLASVS